MADLEAQLIELYGGIVGGERLTRILGYPSQGAFRQAVARNRVPVPVFTIDGRRGKFADVRDIAAWLHYGARIRIGGAPANAVYETTGGAAMT